MKQVFNFSLFQGPKWYREPEESEKKILYIKFSSENKFISPHFVDVGSQFLKIKAS